MKLTKVKRKELKRGDMFCEITARADRPILTAFKDGDDQFFDPITYGTEVHRLDVPDYSHELTQFSWKLKQLDDMVCGIQLVGEEVERLQRENEKLSATIDKIRVAMRKRGSVVAIQAVNQTIYEHDHVDNGELETIDEKTQTLREFFQQNGKLINEDVYMKAKIERLRGENEQFTSTNHALYTQNHKMRVQVNKLFNRIDKQREIIEKLSVDSVVLDKIIGVVYDEDLNLSQAMIKISKIVDKKDD